MSDRFLAKAKAWKLLIESFHLIPFMIILREKMETSIHGRIPSLNLT